MKKLFLTLLLIAPAAHAERFIDIQCGLRTDAGGAPFEDRSQLAYSVQNGFGDGAQSASTVLTTDGIEANITVIRDTNVTEGFVYHLRLLDRRTGTKIEQDFLGSTVVRPRPEGYTQIACKLSG